MPRVKLLISARVRQEFSSSDKLAGAGWFAPSPLAPEGWAEVLVAQAMGTTPAAAASGSCRARSPRACPPACADPPWAHVVSEPALRRARKPLESAGTSASVPSRSPSERYLASLPRAWQAGNPPLVWTVVEPSLLTRQLAWGQHVGETDSNSCGSAGGQ